MRTVATTIAKIVSVGCAVAGVLVAAVATNHNSRATSLDRLAGRVERAQALPEDTRQALRSAILHANERNAATAARIERAMQSKPAVASH